MKTRKGFSIIDIDGQKLQFNWAKVEEGPMLVLYSDSGRTAILQSAWDKVDDSAEYLEKKERTWHGKHKKGAEWAGWGKREAREMIRKFKAQGGVVK